MSRSAKIFALLLMGTGALSWRSPSSAQIATPSLTDGLSNGVQGQKLSYLSPDGVPTQRGKVFSESLRGNGGRAGYMLSHGAIIPNTLRITVGARSLRENVDFRLDAINGVLFFTDPVKPSETVRASYRYVEGADTTRSPLGMQGLKLSLNGAALSLDYGLSFDKAKGLDFTTYGLSLQAKQGLSGMFYMSTPAGNSRNYVDDLSTAKTAQTRKVDPKAAVTDHLISQSLNFNSGASSFRATYQDVGLNFGGFQAMRGSNAGKTDVLNQISQLEKERGIKRLGFAGGLSLGKSDKLSLDWDKLGDGKGDIVSQGLALSSGAVSLSYKTRSVDKDFTRFADIREADRAQLAREKDISRKDFALGLGGGKSSGLQFSQSSVGDSSGELSKQSFALSSKSASFSFSSRKAGEGFKRLSDLTDAEKTNLALDIRRQFNPKAAAGEVSAKDKEQIALEAGLERKQMMFSSALGKQGALSFSQFGVGDGKGDINRQALSLTSGALTFSHMHQRIAEDFGRLAKLSDFERSQFANERGITRDSLGLNLALGKNAGIRFSQLSISDKDGGMERQALAYDAKGVAIKLNLANTDKSFDRAKDLALADPEKKLIEQERGFRSTDFAASLSSIKGLTLDTFNYQGKNAADNLAKNRFRHSIGWIMGKGSKLSLLSEGNSFAGLNGMIDQLKHDLISFERQLASGMKFQLFRDVVETAKGEAAQEVTTDFMHIETDMKKPNNFLAEMKRIDKGDDKFENTTKLDFNYLAGKAVKLRLSSLRIDRGDDPSLVTDTVEWNYKVSKTLSFTGANSETKTNNDQDVTMRSVGLDGKLTEDLNFKSAFTEVEKEAAPTKSVSDFAVSMAKPMDMMGMDDVTITAKYAAVNDLDKKVTEMAAGKIQGKLGLNQVTAEYGSMLDEKGNANIARTLTFSTPKNDKSAVQMDLMYRARNVNRTAVQLCRKYDFGLKVLPRMAITYKYLSLPEDAAFAIQQVKSSGFGMRYGLNKMFNLSVDYATAEDLTKNSAMRRLVTGLTGKLDRLAAVEVVYTVDMGRQGTAKTDAHTIRLSYDRQVDGDHFVTFTTTYVDYKAGGEDDLQARVELKTRF